MNDIMNSKDYMTFLNDIKKDIQTSRVRAALAVNQGLVLLHWRIGNGLLEKQSEKDWDASCVKQLSVDLLHDFPEISAFLPAYLKTMRVFAGHLTDGEIVAQKIHISGMDQTNAK